mmetsp:Transcript_38868/g.85110  ORF Transcript_38868/g.85110 Transcript_38868/m.85110 type:complete len:382 (+) Transcript_38868:24-1169(+)
MALVRAASIVLATLMVVTSAGVSETSPSSIFIEDSESCLPVLVLLQAESRILHGASKPIGQNLQGAAQSPVPRFARSAELIGVEAFQAGGQSQAPDISAMLAQMNATIAKVYDMVSQANSTAMDSLNSVLSIATSFNTSLGQVRTTAEAMKIVLGEQTVAQVVSLVQQVQDILDQLTSEVVPYTDKIQTTLQDILAKYDAEKDKVYEMFMKAVEKVNALSSAGNGTNGTSLLQEGKAEGLPGWLKNIFGGGSSSPCDQAKAAIKTANGTVTEVHGMLTKLNATMCSDVLDQAVVVATDALAQAKTKFDDAMVKYGGQLPATILDKVKQTAATVFGTADKIQAAVDAEKVQLAAMIGEAQTQATSVYDASQSLANTVNSTCA